MNRLRGEYANDPDDAGPTPDPWRDLYSTAELAFFESVGIDIGINLSTVPTYMWTTVVPVAVVRGGFTDWRLDAARSALGGMARMTDEFDRSITKPSETTPAERDPCDCAGGFTCATCAARLGDHDTDRMDS